MNVPDIDVTFMEDADESVTTTLKRWYEACGIDRPRRTARGHCYRHRMRKWTKKAKRLFDARRTKEFMHAAIRAENYAQLAGMKSVFFLYQLNSHLRIADHCRCLASIRIV